MIKQKLSEHIVSLKLWLKVARSTTLYLKFPHVYSVYFNKKGTSVERITRGMNSIAQAMVLINLLTKYICELDAVWT